MSPAPFGFCTHIVQRGLADGVVLDAKHLHHLLHLAEDLSQRDPLRLQLVLDFGVVPLLKRDNIIIHNYDHQWSSYSRDQEVNKHIFTA